VPVEVAAEVVPVFAVALVPVAAVPLEAAVPFEVLGFTEVAFALVPSLF
jgi:hypothetical protein